MYLLTVVGFLIGILVVSLGGGGGLAYVGILVAGFGISPEIAASTSLATIIPTAIVGTISHTIQKNVKYKMVSIMAPSGIVGSLIGSFIIHGIDTVLAKKIFGIVLVIVSIPMLISLFKHKKGMQDEQTSRNCNNTIKSIIYGLMAGLMTGALGLSGTAPVILGLISLGCSTLEVVGTSLFLISILSVAGFLSHLSFGAINWNLILWLLGGTIPGALVSPLLLKKIKKDRLEQFGMPILIFIIILSGILLIK